jgi:TonB family protein
MARRLSKEAQVEVRVLVDETGAVIRTQLVGNKKVGFGFDEAAVEAASRAKYRPATKDGVRVKMWTTVRLIFQNP